jgi:hypothetical protein
MKSGIYAFFLLITVTFFSPSANVQQVSIPIVDVLVDSISTGVNQLQLDNLIQMDQSESLEQLQIIDSDLNEARGFILEGLEPLNTTKKLDVITIDSLD